MLKYSNSFTLAVDESKGSVLIRMMQTTPKFNDDQDITNETEKEVLDTYIVDGDTAKNLAINILEMLGYSIPETD